MFAKIIPASGSLRRRIFFLFAGFSMGAFLLANLIWLPSVTKEIRQAQAELRQRSVQLIRDQVQGYLGSKEADLILSAQRFRPALFEGKLGREDLRLTAQRLLQTESAFEEVGILDEKGKEILRLSRRSAITDIDLADRSTSSLFREGIKQEAYWEPVKITETSEPLGILSIRLPGSDPFLKGLVFGVINLRPLWKLAGEFKLSQEGRVYIVDEKGKLIAAADPSEVLRQLSFADRPFIQRLIASGRSDNRSFVAGDYINERGVKTVATGLLLSRPRWGVVIEQPQSVLFTPIRQKIWFFAGLSLLGFLLSFGLAQTLSRRLTGPLTRLREGAQQIGGGNLAYQVAVETDNEIGALARQFNHMAEQLRAFQEATLAALTIPIMSQTSEMQKVLAEVLAKVMSVTGAEAASIRLVDDEKKEFVFSVCQGFSEAYKNDLPRLIREEGRRKKILATGEPFFAGGIINDSGDFGNLLARDGFRSAVYLPLKTPQKTFGLITLANRAPGRLSAKNANLFGTIAHEIAVALENVSLFQEAVTAKGELEKLNSILTQQAAELASTNAAMAREISERRETENTLSAERERLAVTLRSIGDGVITTDVHGNVTLLNNVAAKLTGWAPAEAMGRPLAEVFHIINARTRERCESRVDQVLKSGGIIGLAQHTALISHDGKEIIIADSAAPIRDRDSKIVGVVLVFRDITEKEKAEQALQNTEKLDAVGVLAAGIAHDFNNLLGGLFGYIDLARVQAAKGERDKLTNTLDKATGVFDRAKHLTQQLLTFSKGGIPVRKTMFLAEQVRKTVLFALSGSNVSPVFSIPEDEWLCDIDENQMAQVFDNIVINARQAMPMGGKLEVAIRHVAAADVPKPLPAHDYVCISIQDHGTGIVRAHLSQIFVPFFTTKDQGSGLGLATSYAIVKKHDGIIEVESEPGKGSTFHIYLPTSSSQPAVTQTFLKHDHQGQGRILIMDDEEFLLDVLSLRLKAMEYDVAMAKDGDKAVVLAREAVQAGNPFQCAILDLTIPGGRGGKDIVKELCEIDPSLKVVASSGYSEDPVMSNPSAFGFAERLIKPYRQDDLARMLESLFSKKSRRGQDK